ncbi:hypothetical protein G6F56_013389 [Rhizopus delemar]|nr:hypothetical protein G6F56_013389 [Rhizopus delemar]
MFAVPYLTSIIHSCLDDSVGRKQPRGPSNAWFWTSDLQKLFDRRELYRRQWKRAVGINKGLRWQEYLTAKDVFRNAMYSRRRATWKQFCETLSSGPLEETTATIKRFRRNRTTSPQFAHPEGPTVAAATMANHLRQVFSGATLPPTRFSAPLIPHGPHDTEEDACSGL